MSAHSNLNQKQTVQEVKANKIIRFKDYAKKIHIPVQESKRVNIFSILENNMAGKKIFTVKTNQDLWFYYFACCNSTLFFFSISYSFLNL